MQVKKTRLVELPPEERDNYRILKLAQIDEAFRLKAWDKLRFLASSGFNLSHRLRRVCDERKDQITYLKKQLFEKAQELNKKQTCDACDLVNSLRVQLAASEVKLEQAINQQTKERLTAIEANAKLVLAEKSWNTAHDDAVDRIVQLTEENYQLGQEIDELDAKLASRGENANNPQKTSD